MISFKNYITEEEKSKSLSAKAKASGISLNTLKKVKARGMAAWKSGRRAGTTPQQWGVARVNAFIRKKKQGGLNHDQDLAHYNPKGDMIESATIARNAAKEAHKKGMNQRDAYNHIQDKVANHYRNKVGSQGTGGTVLRMAMDRHMETGEKHFDKLMSKEK